MTSLVVEIDYTNWRGERSKRRIIPANIRWGRSVFHDGEPQWFLVALDIAKGEDRDFAMKDIHSWEGPK